MPWQVIVWDNESKEGVSGVADHELFRDEDYPEEKALLAAVGASVERMRKKYPEPRFTVLNGSGPGPDDPDAFGSFLAFLLRDD